MGCKYASENGVMKISKNVQILIEGKKTEILYVLQGSIVTSSIAGSSLSLSDLNITKLWSMRLMSERASLICFEQEGSFVWSEYKEDGVL